MDTYMIYSILREMYGRDRVRMEHGHCGCDRGWKFMVDDIEFTVYFN